MGKMTYPIRKIFKDFYGVILEIGPGKTIKTQGMEKLPEEIRNQLQFWLDHNREHVLERLRNEKL